MLKSVKTFHQYFCECCNFTCIKNSDWNRHNITKKHLKLKNINNSTEELHITKLYKCICGIILKHSSSFSRHKKKCKKINEKNDKEQISSTEPNTFILNIVETAIKTIMNTTHNTNIENQNYPINNQLIDIIVNKTKKIEELQELNKENQEKPITIEEKKTLLINNIVIVSREYDSYINVTQLSLACNKNFNEWLTLASTNDLIKDLESDTGIQELQLIDSKKENSSDYQKNYWVHPDLAIQFAQWISPKVGLCVSKWIRKLFINNNDVDIKILQDKENEIKIKDQKIQLLQDICIQKQKRKIYPEKNVIYILTTQDNKEKRIYIIGKAKELKNRLSTYNKTSEHEVVYYKECKTTEIMNVVEMMVLNKLKEYKEKANRDRFVLPIEKEIEFFKNIINDSINFFEEQN
jgi:hypothetical protein